MERKLSSRAADYDRDYEHDYEIPISNRIPETDRSVSRPALLDAENVYVMPGRVSGHLSR